MMTKVYFLIGGLFFCTIFSFFTCSISAQDQKKIPANIIELTREFDVLSENADFLARYHCGVEGKLTFVVMEKFSSLEEFFQYTDIKNSDWKKLSDKVVKSKKQFQGEKLATWKKEINERFNGLDKQEFKNIDDFRPLFSSAPLEIREAYEVFFDEINKLLLSAISQKQLAQIRSLELCYPFIIQASYADKDYNIGVNLGIYELILSLTPEQSIQLKNTIKDLLQQQDALLKRLLILVAISIQSNQNPKNQQPTVEIVEILSQMEQNSFIAMKKAELMLSKEQKEQLNILKKNVPSSMKLNETNIFHFN
jgi:hypothetical protein